MNEHEQVTAEQADRLRAGLLDRDPALESRVRSALKRDGDLARRNELWTLVCGQLQASANDDSRLTNQLRIRRRAVLSGRAVKARRRFTLPQLALATATSVALTLGVMLWMGEHPPAARAPVSRALQIASTDLAHAFVSNVVDIDLDLADNVDLYVWMEGQPAAIIDPAGKGT